MKILALYDSHGNADALEAVLADPRAADPDAVAIGGDAIPGPEALLMLNRLPGIAGPVIWLRGNGEREVGQAAGGHPTSSSPVSPRMSGGAMRCAVSAPTWWSPDIPTSKMTASSVPTVRQRGKSRSALRG